MFGEYGFLSCSAVYFGEIPTFRRNISPSSSELKSKTSKKPADAGGKEILERKLVRKVSRSHFFSLTEEQTCVSWAELQSLRILSKLKVTKRFELQFCQIAESV
jgi:hypothetical protein